MASTATYIPNMLEAINAGAVPGAFNEDRTEFAFPTLAYAGSRGVTHLWTVRVRLLDEAGEYVAIEDEMLDQPAPDLPGQKAEITVVAQQQGGKIRDTIPTYVSVGKNLGKRNATNPLTQAIRNALGLYNKQKKKADIIDLSEASGEAPAPAKIPAKTPAKAPAKAPAKTPAKTPATTSTKAPARAKTPVVEDEDGAGAAAPASDFDPMPPPMLVKKLGDSRDATLTPSTFARGVTAQPKLNGVHYVVFARAGPGGKKTLIRYSRTGTLYPGQEQVAAEMLPMIALAPRLRPGEYGLPVDSTAPRDRRVLAAYGALADGASDPTPYFAGELYLHGKSLNWISGQARRGDDEGLLEFHIFDVFFPRAKAAGDDMESRHRQAYLDAFFAAADAAGLAHPHVARVPNYPARSMGELDALAKKFLAEGYEGAIARKDDAGYRYSYQGYHSANLVKIKPKHDAEFTVVGYTQGTRGKDVGAVIWECEVPNPINPRDRTFTVVPKDLTYENRYSLYKCLGQQVSGPDGAPMTRFERDIRGLPLTVEYAELSAKTGKPLQAKAVAFRTYETGPEHDPVHKLLLECGV